MRGKGNPCYRSQEQPVRQEPVTYPVSDFHGNVKMSAYLIFENGERRSIQLEESFVGAEIVIIT